MFLLFVSFFILLLINHYILLFCTHQHFTKNDIQTDQNNLMKKKTNFKHKHTKPSKEKKSLKKCLSIFLHF